MANLKSPLLVTVATEIVCGHCEVLMTSHTNGRGIRTVVQYFIIGNFCFVPCDVLAFQQFRKTYGGKIFWERYNFNICNWIKIKQFIPNSLKTNAKQYLPYKYNFVSGSWKTFNHGRSIKMTSTIYYSTIHLKQ